MNIAGITRSQVASLSDRILLQVQAWGVFILQSGRRNPIRKCLRNNELSERMRNAMQPGDHGSPVASSPQPHDHVVQFYEDPEFLYRTAADFIAAGILAGQPALVIATSDNRAAIADYLANQEIDVDGLVEVGRYMAVDAQDLLSRFMVEAMPDPRLFRAALGDAVREIPVGSNGAPARAYGEMVDLLWQDGNTQGAIYLEQLWNEILAEHSFSLMCGYRLSGFGGISHAGAFAEICALHSHVLPAETYRRADSEESRMREIARLQQRAQALEMEVQHRKELETALASALSQRRQVEILLQQAAGMHEDLLSIATRELSNPLNVVHLQLMGILDAAEQGRQAYSPEWISYRIGHAALEIQRISRLVEELLGVSRSLSGGLDAQFEEGCLAGILKGIIDQYAHSVPECTIATELVGVAGRWDSRHIAQALTPLLSSAARHSKHTPVEVTLVASPDTATISVTDHGAGVDLFDQDETFDLEHAVPARGRSTPGVELWIADQLVRAMGGNVAVRHHSAGGSTVLVTLPRQPS